MKYGGEITAEVLASGSQRDKMPLLEQFSTDQLMQEIMRRYTLLQTEVADQFNPTGALRASRWPPHPRVWVQAVRRPPANLCGESSLSSQNDLINSTGSEVACTWICVTSSHASARRRSHSARPGPRSPSGRPRRRSQAAVGPRQRSRPQKRTASHVLSHPSSTVLSTNRRAAERGRARHQVPTLRRPNHGREPARRTHPRRDARAENRVPNCRRALPRLACRSLIRRSSAWRASPWSCSHATS